MLKNKGFFLIIAAIGGVFIALNPFLPYWAGGPRAVLTLMATEPGNFAALFIFLSSVVLGVLIVVLSIAVGFARGSIRNLSWGANLLVAVFAFLANTLWWLLTRYQPFAAGPPGYTRVPGLGVYSGLVGSLLALAGLILYRSWR